MTKTSEFLKNSEVWFSCNVGWTVEKFVAEEKKEAKKPAKAKASVKKKPATKAPSKKRSK